MEKILFVTVLFFSSGFVVADSNNGYTTAANVYSGSSSRGWFGGGVDFVLSEWKKERSMSEKSTDPVEADPEAERSEVDTTTDL